MGLLTKGVGSPLTSWTYEGDANEAAKWLPYAIGLLRAHANKGIAKGNNNPEDGVAINFDAMTGRIHIKAGKNIPYITFVKPESNVGPYTNATAPPYQTKLTRLRYKSVVAGMQQDPYFFGYTPIQKDNFYSGVGYWTDGEVALSWDKWTLYRQGEFYTSNASYSDATIRAACILSAQQKKLVEAWSATSYQWFGLIYTAGNQQISGSNTPCISLDRISVVGVKSIVDSDHVRVTVLATLASSTIYAGNNYVAPTNIEFSPDSKYLIVSGVRLYSVSGDPYQHKDSVIYKIAINIGDSPTTSSVSNTVVYTLPQDLYTYEATSASSVSHDPIIVTQPPPFGSGLGSYSSFTSYSTVATRTQGGRIFAGGCDRIKGAASKYYFLYRTLSNPTLSGGATASADTHAPGATISSAETISDIKTTGVTHKVIVGFVDLTTNTVTEVYKILHSQQLVVADIRISETMNNVRSWLSGGVASDSGSRERTAVTHGQTFTVNLLASDYTQQVFVLDTGVFDSSTTQQKTWVATTPVYTTPSQSNTFTDLTTVTTGVSADTHEIWVHTPTTSTFLAGYIGRDSSSSTTILASNNINTGVTVGGTPVVLMTASMNVPEYTSSSVLLQSFEVGALSGAKVSNASNGTIMSFWYSVSGYTNSRTTPIGSTNNVDDTQKFTSGGDSFGQNLVYIKTLQLNGGSAPTLVLSEVHTTTSNIGSDLLISPISLTM